MQKSHATIVNNSKVQLDDTIEKYQKITLNFGKFNGKSLKEVFDMGKDGISYLSWLRDSLRNSNKELSPTQKAIFKYCDVVILTYHDEKF